LGNFLLVSLIFIHLLQSLYLNEKKNRLFLITLILIILFDILVLGFFFGSEKLLERYSFLSQEIKQFSTTIEMSLSRGDLAQFAYIEFKKFILFGYGGGGFEYLLKINYQNLSTHFAVHAHSDLIEFMGEFGLIGSMLLVLSILFISIKNKSFNFKNIILFYLLFFILTFDFSFHIPIIQLLFILLLSINYNKSYILNRKNNK
jgi:O-antigen ligase